MLQILGFKVPGQVPRWNIISEQLNALASKKTASAEEVAVGLTNYFWQSFTRALKNIINMLLNFFKLFFSPESHSQIQSKVQRSVVD